MQRAGYFLLTLMLLSGNLDYASGGSPDEPDSVVLRKRILEMEDGMLADYPVALAKAKQVHQAALESSCLSCIALSHKLQGKFLLENGEYPVSLIHFRKAASLFERLNDRATLAAVLDQIGIIHYYQAYYDSGAYYFDKALRTYEVDKNLQGMITVLHNTALMYHRKGDFQKSIGFLFREEQLKDQLGQSNHEIEALANMGSLMVDSIYYQEEIADELKAIEIHRKTNDRRSISRAYRNIGKAYRQLENYRLAAQYFVMAARIMDELGFVPEWDLAATDYRDANQKDSCFYYHYLAKQDFKRKMQPDIAYTLDLLGDAHRYFNQHDSALYYYDSALNMSYRMNNRITFTGIHWHLVNVHTALGNFKEAERHLAKGLALAKEVALIHEKNFYREGKVLYEKMGDYKKALIFSEKYRVLIDSINRAETALNLTKMQAEFKTAKKARQVDELQQENLLHEAQMETRNLQMALAVALLLVIASIGGIYYSRYRQKKKSSERLQMMNEEKEVLLHEIHHRVKNNLQIISSLINLKSRQASTETNEALRQLNGRIFSMGLIHEKLYQQDNIKSLRLDEYLTEVSEHLLSSFEEKEYPIRLKLNCQPIEIDADTALTCCLIANEIVTNSVKYAFAPDQKDREVALVLDQDKESIQLDISDNGQKNQELPGNFKKSFGFRFVDQLVNAKLEGQWSIRVENGFHVSIKFATPFNA